MLLRIIITACTIFAAASLTAQEATNAPIGVLRVLDRTTGVVADVEVTTGQPRRVGLLTIALNECRFPTGNPTGDAYAELDVFYRDSADPVFRGWMIASSPALNAMDHARYDVWPLRCKTS